MENLEIKLNEIEREEKELQFDYFNSSSALKIGLIIIEKAKKLSKPIAIDITKNYNKLFYYSFDGASPDNYEWIRRKNNVVNRFFRSSLYIGTKLKLINKTIEEKYLISSKEYAPFGGAFPIIIKNTGVVGTITVSGLSQDEDHDLVVESIKEYLKLLQNNKE